MSNRDYAKNLIDQIPEGKMVYIIAYLQGAAVPEEAPNSETIAAMKELEDGAAPCSPEAPLICSICRR